VSVSTSETADSKTTRLPVEHDGGRSCESCALRLERQLEATAGVREASVSFLAGNCSVTFEESTVSRSEIEAIVREFGVLVEDADGRTDRDRLRREALFVGLTLFGMGLGLVTDLLGGPSLLVWSGYATAYVFGGWYGLLGSIASLRARTVDIDLLMILAALGALVIGAPFEGAMLLFLFSLSNTLQHYAIGRSRRAIESLVELRPETAQVVRGEGTETVPIDEVAVGDVFVVRPGDRIPLDGVVVEGESTVDQSSLTGESVPVLKAPGEAVFGGTITENGSLKVRVTKVAQESAIARLIDMVENAQSEKAPTQRLIDRLEQPYVLGVFGMTGLAIALPLAVGATFEPTFYRAMTLMVAASPCAVVISTPAAVLSAIAAGARQGVLFKGGEHVETAATIDAVAFDKTGTLTEGNTRLTDVGLQDGVRLDAQALTENRLLALAAAVQARSEHHLGAATVEAAEQRGLDIPGASEFRATVGKGVKATVDGRTLHIGNQRYFESLSGTFAGIDAGERAITDLEAAGKTSVLVGVENNDERQIVGWLAYTDTLREGAPEVIERLRDLGIEHVVMLTGDNERVAEAVGAEAGVDAVRAELLPEQKVEAIGELVAKYDGVAMVGDGVNDAPALATATLGVAMGGAGTDVALETADVVLMADDLGKLPYVLGLSRKTRTTLVVNLAISFGAIGVMILAILISGIPLPLAVVGHEGSTVLVSLNGLRLLGVRE
jgi:Cd2+/Zn2+-exporting ATPase